MRPSVVSLAFRAGTLIVLCMFAGVSQAAACCPGPEANKLNEVPAFDEGRADAEEVLPSVNALPAPTPLNLSPEAGLDKTSYADVFGILKGDNPCSRFFGGANTAVTVFNEFATRLRKGALGAGGLAIRMSGGYTNYHNAETGASYRLFDEATVNSQGPMPMRAALPAGSRMRVGKFTVETRQAKALILLHELGHLIKGEDGDWLLPQDGSDSTLSERNSWEVQAQCLGQLLTLGR